MTTVSIIICTRDRAESLKLTLVSISAATIPHDWAVELLVVDNGSSDHTEATVQQAVLPNVHLRYVNETNRGLSNARNRGLRETEGELILFTDDDIRVPTNWVVAMCEPLLSGTADAVAGGVIFPPEIAIKLSQPPLSSQRSWFASTEDIDPVSPSRMVGANMAFHRRVLETVPSFDTELGPGKNAMGFGDETMFSLQLLSAGYRLSGALDVAVNHHFDVSRLKPAYLLEIARGMGRTDAFIFHHWEHKRIKLVWRRLFLTKIRLYKRRLFNSVHREHQGVDLAKALLLEYSHTFCQEYLCQIKRSPKYPKPYPLKITTLLE